MLGLNAKELVKVLRGKKEHVVKVRFKENFGALSEKVYSYRTDLDLKEGDEALVRSPTSGITIVVVEEVVKNDSRATKKILQKVDLEGLRRAELSEEILEERVVNLIAEAERRKTINEARELLTEVEGAAKDSVLSEFDALVKELESGEISETTKELIAARLSE